MSLILGLNLALFTLIQTAKYTPTPFFFQIVKSAPKGRFTGIKRNYQVEDVLKLRGSFPIEYTIATRTANKLWQLLHTDPYTPALGALTGNQAVQMVKAGLKAIYLSGKTQTLRISLNFNIFRVRPRFSCF